MQNSPKAPWRFRISVRGDAGQFLITCWPSDIAGAHPGEVAAGDFVEVCGRLNQHKYVTFQGQQRERLELVGGTCTIDSAPGKGSTFSLRVPLGSGDGSRPSDGTTGSGAQAIQTPQRTSPRGDDRLTRGQGPSVPQ